MNRPDDPPSSAERNQGPGCLQALLSFGFMFVAWFGGVQICLYYNQTAMGVFMALFLLPFAMKAGIASGIVALGLQVGARATRVVVGYLWRAVLSIPRRLIPGRARPISGGDEFWSIFAGLKWWPVITGYLVGSLAVSTLGALLLQIGAIDPMTSSLEMVAVLGAYDAIFGMISTYLLAPFESDGV